MKALRLQVYVLGRTLAGVAAALGLLSAVIMLIDLVELSRTLSGKTELSFIELLFLDSLKSPAVILVLLPFVFLFGVMAAFVSLSRRGELIAMRAAGVSAWRFLAPAAAAAFLIGVVTVVALNPAAAALNGRFEDRRAALADDPSNAAGGDIWLRQGDDREQIVIHAKAHDTVDQTLRLTGVSLFVQSVGRGGALAFSRRIEAARALLVPGYWRLSDVREAAPGEGATRSEQMLVPSTLDHRSAMEKFASPGAIAFWDLPSTIHSATLAGYSAAPYRLRLQQLLATPLMFTAMAVLAGAFSLRLMRLGDYARVAAVGVVLGFGVFFLNQFCGALGSNGEIPASLAAWTPPLLALLAGVTLLCFTEDG
jgi:lipopolysaccharide export system permease protein